VKKICDFSTDIAVYPGNDARCGSLTEVIGSRSIRVCYSDLEWRDTRGPSFSRRIFLRTLHCLTLNNQDVTETHMTGTSFSG